MLTVSFLIIKNLLILNAGIEFFKSGVTIAWYIKMEVL